MDNKMKFTNLGTNLSIPYICYHLRYKCFKFSNFIGDGNQKPA